LSYKVLQLSPQASTEGIRARTAIQDSWSGFTGSRESGFPGSWIEDERDIDEGSDGKGAISGLALATAFSASFWAAVALLVMRNWG
jgi:hypothetical protein